MAKRVGVVTVFLAAAIGIGTYAGTASARSIQVNAAEVDMINNGNCSLYEAVQSVANDRQFGAPPEDNCVWAADGQVEYFVRLQSRTYAMENGVLIDGLTLVGTGVNSTTIVSDGRVSSTLIWLGDGGEISNLTLRGQLPAGRVQRGVEVLDHDSSAQITPRISNVKITGFNDGGVVNGLWGSGDACVELASVEIWDSTIDSNTRPAGGGGLWNCGEAHIHRSAITNNTATHGGGINVKYGQVFAYNSTIAYNRATAGRGGGVHSQPASGFAEFNAYHVTIAYNSASTASGGGGVYVDAGSQSNKVNASLIANNTSGSNGVADDYRGRLRGTIQTQDGLNGNLLGTNSNPPGIITNCSPTTSTTACDFISTAPGLVATLAANPSGDGLTHPFSLALTSSSPALNKSTNAAWDAGTGGAPFSYNWDQRGRRPNAKRDHGAYER